MSSKILKSLTNWSTKSSQALSVPDYTNVGLINTDPLDQSNIDLVSPQINKFVLLPSANQTAETSLQAEEISVAEVYIGQALAYFEQQQWSDSIAACQEALRVYPKMGMAFKIWGNCLQRSGKSAEAIGVYAKALEAKADMAEIYCNLGSIYAKQRKWQQAIKHYQKSIIINGDNATPYRNLARVWDELQEYDKSADCFFQAINLQPNLLSAQNHFILANTLIAEGKVTQAIACYKSCIELEPKFLNAYARLADVLEQDGQTEEALFYFKKLANLQTQGKLSASSQSKSSQHISALLKPSEAKAALLASPKKITSLPSSQEKKPVLQLKPATTKLSDKIANYLQAASQQPNSASIQFELGRLYFADQQWSKAIACYLRAVEIKPQTAKYYVHLGRAYSKANYHTKGNLAYYKGFSLQPQKVSAKNQYLLGEKLLKQNEVDKAIACYRRAIT